LGVSKELLQLNALFLLNCLKLLSQLIDSGLVLGLDFLHLFGLILVQTQLAIVVRERERSLGERLRLVSGHTGAAEKRGENEGGPTESSHVVSLQPE
jgi:hypothetical protein